MFYLVLEISHISSPYPGLFRGAGSFCAAHELWNFPGRCIVAVFLEILRSSQQRQGGGRERRGTQTISITVSDDDIPFKTQLSLYPSPSLSHSPPSLSLSLCLSLDAPLFILNMAPVSRVGSLHSTLDCVLCEPSEHSPLASPQHCRPSTSALSYTGHQLYSTSLSSPPLPSPHPLSLSSTPPSRSSKYFPSPLFEASMGHGTSSTNHSSWLWGGWSKRLRETHRNPICTVFTWGLFFLPRQPSPISSRPQTEGRFREHSLA